MELQLITPLKPATSPPDPQGWTRYWHGYFQHHKVRSHAKKARDKKTHAPPRDASDQPQPLTENKIERLILLNIIREIDTDEISMFELGAGRGDWCLAVAGVVDHKLIDCRARSVRCLAVEGEPTHYQWTVEHFARQNISAEAVHGAAYSHNGTCRFSAVEDPADNYGQSVTPNGQIEVPAYTVDTLAERYGFQDVDIFHMDVQGAEVEVLLGSRRLLLSGSPRYLMIGTHGAQLNRQIRFLLKPFYDFVLDFPPRAGVVFTPLGPANIPADGIMLLRRKQRHYPWQTAVFRVRDYALRHFLKRRSG